MKEPLKAVKVKENVWWVGAIDWNLRNFHGYTTPRGSTYNAYLIVDEKIALIDTVKAPFAQELIARISSVVDPAKIDYVVSNHVEMDHAGSLDAVRAVAPNATYCADKRAIDGINRHFQKDWKFHEVKTGDSISLGKRSLTFVEVPMVHWPDSMVTYCPEDKALYPNDAFGQHMASLERFDDQFPWEEVRAEASKYYANIVLPFDAPVKKALDTVAKLDIDMIAPSHGIIWRKHVEEIVACYASWADNETKDKAVVVYDTMWEATAAMARAIAEGCAGEGVEVRLHNLRMSDTSFIMQEILDARAVVVGSPTLNNCMLPTVAGFLEYMKGLKPKGRIGFAFGSHGWAGGAVKAVEAQLNATGIELVEESIAVRYTPADEELAACREAGVRLAKKILAKG